MKSCGFLPCIYGTQRKQFVFMNKKCPATTSGAKGLDKGLPSMKKEARKGYALFCSLAAEKRWQEKNDCNHRDKKSYQFIHVKAITYL